MLKRIERGLTRAEEWVLVALILFLVVVSFLQVVLRVLFSTGILWADTLLRHLVLWVGFLGAALAASSNRQFAMDATDRVIKGKLKQSVHILCHAFTAVVSWFLLLASISFFREEYSHSDALFTALGHDVPTWIFESILPIGFALLLLHYIVKCALDFTKSSDSSA